MNQVKYILADIILSDANSHRIDRASNMLPVWGLQSPPLALTLSFLDCIPIAAH